VPAPITYVKITVLTFAQTRTQLGFAEKSIECEPVETPREILRRIAPQFDPGKIIRVAVNQEYADWDEPVGEAFELALIPPVSGG
jgi:molybdopterin converting factor small subunit